MLSTKLISSPDHLMLSQRVFLFIRDLFFIKFNSICSLLIILSLSRSMFSSSSHKAVFVFFISTSSWQRSPLCSRLFVQRWRRWWWWQCVTQSFALASHWNRSITSLALRIHLSHLVVNPWTPPQAGPPFLFLTFFPIGVFPWCKKWNEIFFVGASGTLFSSNWQFKSSATVFLIIGETVFI